MQFLKNIKAGDVVIVLHYGEYQYLRVESASRSWLQIGSWRYSRVNGLADSSFISARIVESNPVNVEKAYRQQLFGEIKTLVFNKLDCAKTETLTRIKRLLENDLL